MSLRRFNASQITNNTVILTGDEHNHLSRVLRLSVGDKVIVNIGDNNDYICIISSINKVETVLNVEQIVACPSISKVSVTLFACVIKGSAMDMVIAKAVEMGVTQITPVLSAYSVGDTANKSERLNTIAIQASKQCGRADIVKVNNQISFVQMLNTLNNYQKVIFCNEREQNNHILTALLENPATNIALIVGCEGGFSLEEHRQLLNVSNVISVTLGKRIYRAETASLAALAIVDAVANR